MLLKFSSRKKMKLAMLLMLILVLLMFSCISRLSAKFVSSAIGRDSARVAVFDIKESGIFEDMVFLDDFYPGRVGEQDVEIRNSSEVAVSYSMHLTYTEYLPLDITIEGLDPRTMSTSGYLAAGESVTKKMTLSWPEEEDDYKYSGMVDAVKITVSAEQID